MRPERFAWTDHSWAGVPREGLVLYELHVGTFTLEGTSDLAWKALFSSEAERYLGRRSGAGAVRELLPHECVVFGPAGWEGLV